MKWKWLELYIPRAKRGECMASNLGPLSLQLEKRGETEKNGTLTLIFTRGGGGPGHRLGECITPTK